jgi:carboxymethylenebutenolidase
MRFAHAFAGIVSLAVAAGAAAQQAQDEHAAHAAQAPAAAPAAPAAPRDPALPPSDEQAKAALETTPRHTEWYDVAVPGGSTRLRVFAVYPERKDKAPVVIVIHEIFGLSDWIRGVADQLARDGFIAVAPDLITGLGPNGGGTDSMASRDDVVKAIRGLSPEETAKRLDAVHAWAEKLPAASGKTATVGFCWGGSASFAYATKQPALDAAVVYYGSSPDAAALASAKAPVLGLYGADDARVNATIEPAKAELARLGRSYEVEIYEGAGHGFLRQQSGREGANLKATQGAWPRTLAFIRKHAGN